jgi:hypothetical protein
MQLVTLLVLTAFPAPTVPAQAPEQLELLMPSRVTPPDEAPTDPWAGLPDDPLQRVAYRAVVLNEWPDTPQWKLNVYARVLDHNIQVQGAARRTTYCPRCAGRICADGSRVRDGICAASRNIPMHAIIWLASDGLLKVTDRGGLVRVDGRCQARGENANFDVWKPSCVAGCWTGPGTLPRVPWAQIPANTDTPDVDCLAEK